MIKIAPPAAALLLVLPALAGAAPPGLNLRWDQCYADGGVQNRTFACNTNLGVDELLMSFVLPQDMPDVSGNEIVLKIQSASATLPSWWDFKLAGACRQSSLSLSTGFHAGAVNCVDWSNGLATGGIGSYQAGFAGPNTARLAIAIAVAPPEFPALLAGQEYISCALNINHAKSVGSGACPGCDQPTCLAFEQLLVTTPVAADNVRVTGGANAPDSEFVRWQNGLATDVSFECHVMSGCTHTFSCVDASTPTHNSTWGAVKALYR